jgi:large subunit ribosomal protein L24
MQKQHIKRGDTVVAIAGAHKGKQGKVLEVLVEKQRARVEGLALIKRHLKKSQEHPQGSIVEREGSIHVSNLMQLAKWEKTKSAGKEAATKA